MLRLINAVGNLLNPLIAILVGVAMIVFFWGLVKFIFKLGGDVKVEEGRRLMVWGIVALFVMLSVWGIIGFFQRQLGLPDTTIPAPGEDIRNFNPFDDPRQNA